MAKDYTNDESIANYGSGKTNFIVFCRNEHHKNELLTILIVSNNVEISAINSDYLIATRSHLVKEEYTIQIEQLLYGSSGNIQNTVTNHLRNKAQFVLIFGAKKLLLENRIYDELRNLYPNAYFIGGTTSGEIHKNIAVEDTLSATAVYMEKSEIRFASVVIESENYFEAAANLATKFAGKNLKHVFIISEGININGSRLVEGLTKQLPPGVTLSGGLSGDGKRFEETFVIANNYPKKNCIAAIAFYGENIKFGCSSMGGWSPFGIERLITKSKSNILYEFDGKPALDLYKEYLGEYAEELPAAGLYFPLMVHAKDYSRTFVRTIQGIDELQKALIFSGDIPVGHYAKLMKTNYDSLIAGSRQAAQTSLESLGINSANLAILVSGVGRKLVLNQMVSEEIDAVRYILGKETIFTGFYSYGEISPLNREASCELHNQTMTITLIAEV